MKLRVREEADKGHNVAGAVIEPGEELPGDYAEVPHGLGHKIEPKPKPNVEKKLADMAEKVQKLRAEADALEAEAARYKAEEEQRLLDEAAEAKAKAEKKAAGKVDA
jgi:hypothetical protein